ncbi:MAG: hypothetical protein JF616_08365 [Fibrobacteres bacterium]|nr:hypothetical protein [Fibrobacterota bacterium]
MAPSLSHPAPPRSGPRSAAAFVLAAAVSVSALNHTVTDFRLDWNGAASDTFFLDAGWKDSLLLKAKRNAFKTMLVARLNEDAQGHILNSPGGGAAAAVTGDYGFKVAYLQWNSPHTAANANSPGPADIMVKNIALSPDTAAIDVAGTIIAGQEVPGKPPPVFLNFAADGPKYAAYWGSNTAPGPIRRTTHLNAASGAPTASWGQDVTPTAPVAAAGYGKVGMGQRPGSGGEDYALAYETKLFPGQFEIRWESIGAGTSVASALYNTAQWPQDFAVALDSSGNTMVLWREQQAVNQGSKSDMWMVGFDPSHTEIYPPTKIETDIFADDTVSTTTTAFTHYYRPFAITSQANKRFLILFGSPGSLPAGAGQSRIYARSLTLDSLGPGVHDLSARTDLTPPGDVAPFRYMYPDVRSSRDRVAVAWFKRGPTNFTQRLMGSIFNKNGPVYTTQGRVDMDFTNDFISFGPPTNGLWYQYHYFKCANLALDEKGDMVVAYDSGTAAKVALVRNTPIYNDSGAFISKILEVKNPAIPSFVFDPASDSVAFQVPLVSALDSGYSRVKVALSADSAFGAPDAGFQTLAGPSAGTRRYFRYKVELSTNITGDTATSNLKTAKVKSVRIDYDIKPWKPQVDSLKIGAAAFAAYDPFSSYSLLPRKDSLKLIVSGFDADDDGMAFRVQLGGRVYPDVNGSRTAPGRFRAVISVMPPDTLLDPLPLKLTAVDPQAWASAPANALFGYNNIPPTQTVTIYRGRGRDSASVFRPSGGGTDTLHPASGDLIVLQTGDSLAVKAKYTDGNDDNITAQWFRNSTRMGTRPLPVTDSLTFKFTPDHLNPWIDTLVLSVSDPNVTLSQRFPVRINRNPEIDTVWHAAYQGKDSVWKSGPFDRVSDFASDTGLIIPAGLPTRVQAVVSDSDMAYGDSVGVRWKVWRKGTSACPTGNMACYQIVDSADGETLTRVFSTPEQYLTVRVTDKSGAFRERRLWLEYPVLDTAGTTDFAASVKSLTSGIDFIIGAEQHDTVLHAEIRSQGSSPLRIVSVATQRNDRKWLNVNLEWLTGSPPRPDSAKFAGPTTANALAGGKTISLPPGATLGFDFRFLSDSLRGDSVLIDTLLVQTNDFANPVLKIPFRMVYNDLPLVTLGVPGLPGAGPPGGYNAAGLPRFLPARSTLSLAFSETVRIADPSKVIRVYSLLDSLKYPRGFHDIHGNFEYVRKRAPKRAAGGSGAGTSLALAKAAAGNFGLAKGAVADSLADQLIFTPAYDRPSDSLKVTPLPGFFVYRDILRIRLSNGIVDRAGNGLDLRLDKKAAAPGSLDTVFQARVDTSVFRVTGTVPDAGGKGWGPEDPIRIRFNRKLALPPPAGRDTLTLLALGSLKAADSRAIRVTSVYRPGRPYDFQSISLEEGDSALLLHVRPRLPAEDTVTVELSGGILDSSGLPLDGNGDGIPQWLYDRRDTVDQFSFSFGTSQAEFYVFPNPFRFGDPRHREKGTITFKNLNSLHGFTAGDELTLRVHTLNGDLVYDSGLRNGDPLGPTRRQSTSLDWDLKNDGGSTVGTGVYIYSLSTGGRTLLHKGKVAVVR